MTSDKKYMICVWMNFPSHHQSTFFQALDERADVDLQVRYFHAPCGDRAAEGWADEHETRPYETFCEPNATPSALLAGVPAAAERVHLISRVFHPELVNHFVQKNVRWCHWSEAPGIRLAAAVGFRARLFRWLNPLMLLLKRGEGARMRASAVGVLAQGELARRAFRWMGVPAARIEALYYAPPALGSAKPCEKITSFAEGGRVFLSVGALCPRKGIDVLIRAFARLNAPEWKLVFCGLDKMGGEYQRLAKVLGVADRVLFLGAWPSERIAEVFAAADVFVLASRFDGWGAVLNEAASVGLPLIGTDLCGAAWHAIEPEKNGRVVKAGSVKELADAMERLASNQAALKEAGDHSARIFEEKLTPTANAERLVNALEKWGVHAS
mgnify:CR=1 FL=1